MAILGNAPKSKPLFFNQVSSSLESVYASADWSESAIGAPHAWPEELRLIANLILAADTPMFIAWGSDLNLMYNQPYAAILGARHPSALGRPLAQVWPEVSEHMAEMVALVRRGETCSLNEQPFQLLRNGRQEQAWFTFSFSPVFDKCAQVQGIFCAIRETTADVLAREAREKEIQRWESIFDNAPGMLVVLRGPEHIFEVANKTYRDLIGRQDLIGKKVCDVLPELCEQGYLDLLDTVYRDGKAHQAQAMPVKLRSPVDGTTEEFFFDFIYQPMKNDDGEVEGIFAEGIDITATFTAATALRNSERRYRGLMDIAPGLVWIARNDRNLAYCNQQWYAYTGLQLSQIWDQGWSRVVHPDYLHELVQTWEEGKKLGARWRVNVPLRRGSNGEFEWHLVQAAPIKDDHDNVFEWIGVAVSMLELNPDSPYAAEFSPVRAMNTH